MHVYTLTVATLQKLGIAKLYNIFGMIVNRNTIYRFMHRQPLRLSTE